MKKDSSNFSGDLRVLAWKLCGMAYLIRQQKFDETPPMDIEEIHYGIGIVLEEIGNAVREIAEAIE